MDDIRHDYQPGQGPMVGVIAGLIGTAAICGAVTAVVLLWRLIAAWL